MYGENRFRRYKSVQLRIQRFIRLIRHPRLNMSVFIVLFIASLALVNQAHPHGGHGADTLHDGDHLDFLDLAAIIATSTQHNDIDDEAAHLTKSKLLSCISEESRNEIHEQCEEQFHGNPDHTPSMTAICILNMMNVIDNATGIVDISLLNVLTIEPTSLTTEQKILASGNLKSCIESNYTLPTPPDFMLASRNMTKEDFVKKYDRNSAMRTIVCAVKALIENGCSSASPMAALVVAPVNSNDDSSSDEDSSRDNDDD
ncbi:uncharacterized protein LOC116936529 isoform X2 [Daphnia magna]|uniref:uncharacterized protein LOC116936529 isoform X2 n=1 Tax=Daphnia magna TaxID=35525 RepID=UPI001E1BBA9E|nr:uncharacterized protein LOC116936529 isoform X2 [Daphnia magna]